MPTPGPIGRTTRLLVGAVLLVLSILTFLSWRGYVRIGAPEGPWWLLTAASLYALGDLVDIGLGRSAGRRAQAIALVLIAVVAAVDLLMSRNLWAPPLGALLYVLNGAGIGIVGLSFGLAGLADVPGCELRAVPWILAHPSNRSVETRY